VKREYVTQDVINGRKFRRIVIDSHYEKRHGDTMTDTVIVDLLRALQEARQVPEATTEDGFEIFVTEPVFRKGKPYRLVWTTHPDENCVGVINAFRRRHGKVPK
jgi:hypothetical protein